ncbi:unnamed protein product, partial [Polarella glacialis]
SWIRRANPTMGLLRTVRCFSGKEVAMDVDEEHATVTELRQQVAASLGLLQVNSGRLLSGKGGGQCIASNRAVADLLGLCADIVVPTKSFKQVAMLQPWSLECEAEGPLHLGIFEDKETEAAQADGPRLQLWDVHAISFLETRYGAGYILFGSDP